MSAVSSTALSRRSAGDGCKAGIAGGSISNVPIWMRRTNITATMRIWSLLIIAGTTTVTTVRMGRLIIGRTTTVTTVRMGRLIVVRTTITAGRGGRGGEVDYRFHRLQEEQEVGEEGGGRGEYPELGPFL